MKLILASGSKSRKAIFDMLGFKYEVLVSNVEENCKNDDFNEYVMELSKLKAHAVKNKVLPKKAIIISADSIICLGNKKFEKPKNKQEAYLNIKALSGKVNCALTGVTICDLYQNKELTFFDKTDVYFKKIEDSDIEWYVNHEEHLLERAGYSIADGNGAIFVDKIDGDFYTVVGMPIGKLYDNLKNLGYSANDFCKPN